jgi:hypothetical protein
MIYRTSINANIILKFPEGNITHRHWKQIITRYRWAKLRKFESYTILKFFSAVFSCMYPSKPNMHNLIIAQENTESYNMNVGTDGYDNNIVDILQFDVQRLVRQEFG